MTLHVSGAAAAFDDRRNTSRQRMPEPGAAQRGLEAMARLRQHDPALVRWIEDGHPLLTEAEHRRRFGCDYNRGR
jgi:hypothetical protein